MADLDNEAAAAAADDLELTNLLSAELDKAEGITPATADVPEPETTEPETETAEQKAERVRDEKGRFAKAEEKTEAPKTDAKPDAVEKAAPVVEAKQPEVAKVAPVVEAPATDTTLRPPPGWAPAAKAAFLDLPRDHPIVQAVAKREEEVNKGLAKLAEYKPIERFAEMARQSGTTLDRALENYTGIEQTLRRDFIGGIAAICQRQNVDPVALANVILARAGVTPTQQGDAGNQPQANQRPGVDLSPVYQELNALKTYVQQQQSQGVQSEISRFASDPKHTFFENVKEQMGHLLNAGVATDLADAYDKACWANPEIRPLLIKQQSTPSDVSAKAAQAATQARQAAKSITGSPLAGASAKGPVTSIEDELRSHWEAAAV